MLSIENNKNQTKTKEIQRVVREEGPKEEPRLGFGSTQWWCALRPWFSAQKECDSCAATSVHPWSWGHTVLLVLCWQWVEEHSVAGVSIQTGLSAGWM